MTFSSNVLSIEKQGQVGIVWLDREPKYNALSTELWSAIPHALDALCEDPEIGAIILAGRGKHFCAGIDLAEDGLSASQACQSPLQSRSQYSPAGQHTKVSSGD